MVARFLRAEIDGVRSGTLLELSEEIDFTVPQFWDCGLPHLVGSQVLPFNLRMKKDIVGRRLALKIGGTIIRSSSRRRLLRKQRIVFVPGTTAAPATGPIKFDLPK